MKSTSAVERQARNALSAALSSVPMLSVSRGQATPHAPWGEFTLRVSAAGARWTLPVEVLTSGPPRLIRQRLAVLEANNPGKHIYPVVVAPWLSPESRALLADRGAGFVDLAGNCRLAFGAVFIERVGFSPPRAVHRAQRSLFSPKSARVLRLLLGEPGRVWKVKELEAATEISLGQVSNVRRGLLEMEWAEEKAQGLRLSRPGALLDAWRADYRPRHLTREFHTVLHGLSFDEAVRQALAFQRGVGEGHGLLLRGASAAQWLAPLTRDPTLSVFARDWGEEHLVQRLSLTRVERGGNVQVTRPSDDGLMFDALEAAPSIFTTGIAQTCLDLWAGGERDVEAGDHLRKERFDSMWEAAL